MEQRANQGALIDQAAQQQARRGIIKRIAAAVVADRAPTRLPCAWIAGGASVVADVFGNWQGGISWWHATRIIGARCARLACDNNGKGSRKARKPLDQTERVSHAIPFATLKAKYHFLEFIYRNAGSATWSFATWTSTSGTCQRSCAAIKPFHRQGLTGQEYPFLPTPAPVDQSHAARVGPCPHYLLGESAANRSGRILK